MLILASKSPQRRELLQQIGIVCQVEPSRYVEHNDGKAEPVELVRSQALGKAIDVARKFPGRWVLGADTIVVIDNLVLGKPADENNAVELLRSLSGRQHTVVTGVALLRGVDFFQEYVSTKVWFRPLSEEDIHTYVQSGEPMDKAGAYGIQGKGAGLVEKINGSYTNVVGLPMERVLCMLKKAGVIEHE